MFEKIKTSKETYL